VTCDFVANGAPDLLAEQAAVVAEVADQRVAVENDPSGGAGTPGAPAGIQPVLCQRRSGTKNSDT
jgi:hypothetical protein